MGLPDELVIGFNPVSYLEKDKLHSEINTVIERIEENQTFLRSIDSNTLIDHIFTMLLDIELLNTPPAADPDCAISTMWRPSATAATV